jgi:hypothetical protein
MSNSTAKKIFGTVVAALTLTLVTNVAPAQAAPSKGGTVTLERRDTGWDIP